MNSTTALLLCATISLCLALCGGREVELRVVHGIVGQPGQFPWHAILVDSTNSRLFCGATLLTASYAATAAHCVAVNRIQLLKIVLKAPLR